MTYIKEISIHTIRKHPYPFDVPAIKNAKNIHLDNPITFFIGENGSGKSTLLETIACRLQLPHLDGSGYYKKTFEASLKLVQYLEVIWTIERSTGFFFRAEDFGNYLNSVHRADSSLYNQMKDLEDDISPEVFKQMRESANHQLHSMRKNYGQELDSFSHGEAYLHLMNLTINKRGIYILDEPEAALSPAKQLSFIYFLKDHLTKFNSQFIIATHSPILMSFPDASIYEISDEEMTLTPLKETNHYSITKSFLNNPESFLRHL